MISRQTLQTFVTVAGVFLSVSAIANAADLVVKALCQSRHARDDYNHRAKSCAISARWADIRGLIGEGSIAGCGLSMSPAVT